MYRLSYFFDMRVRLKCSKEKITFALGHNGFIRYRWKPEKCKSLVRDMINISVTNIVRSEFNGEDYNLERLFPSCRRNLHYRKWTANFVVIFYFKIITNRRPIIGYTLWGTQAKEEKKIKFTEFYTVMKQWEWEPN